MKKINCLLLLLLCLSFSSCSMRSESYDYAYLNNRYNLWAVADIHGKDPFYGRDLYAVKDVDLHNELFDLENSYLNFQCKGESYSDFHCEGELHLYNSSNQEVLIVNSFNCSANVSLYTGMIVFYDEVAKEKIGDIYISTPYWCRIQLYYDIQGTGEKTLLTFEFFKGKFNDLPEFLQ